DVQAYRPCILYLNGVYWGLYNIREKLNEDYLASHHGVDPDAVDILDDYHTLYPLVVEGDADHYNVLIDYLQSHSLASAQNAAYVKTRMDIGNYLTYMAVQIFIANQDGPGHNCKFWRPASLQGRYRWLLYDTDHAFSMRLFVPYYHFNPEAYLDNTIAYYREENGPSWPNPPESTFLFRKILESPEFRDAFINRLADLMNTCFSEEAVDDAVEDIVTRLEPEMKRHLVRWGGSPAQWMKDVEVVRDFGLYRSDALREHLAGEFGLSGTARVELRISPADAGSIKINSVIPDSYPWSGIYFRGLPISLNALPAPGLRFSGWTGISDNSSRVSIEPSGAGIVTAHFKASNGPACALVINEMNYHSSPGSDAGDWVELYNPHAAAVNLGGWILQDENPSNGFVFPAGTSIDADGFLICCSDIRAFRNLFPEVKNAAGDLDFGLDSEGERVLLIDPAGYVVDSLTYGTRAPWPAEPDGNGPALALRAPDLDNSLGGHWAASAGFGTPGRSNEFQDPSSSVPENLQPGDFCLLPNYPNPFDAAPASGSRHRSGTSILFSLPRSARIALRIYDIRGRLVREIAARTLNAGLHEMPWDGRDNRGLPVPCGVYICRMQVEGIQGLFMRKLAVLH
ncbi:CotH kinase family protein, partial [bacterium]|nr:CotH kinase family protein [bacterium]